MAAASYEQFSFLSGEWSKSVQGRIDRPDYRTAMNVNLNGLPVEQGAWTRRPGTQFLSTTRGGVPGRVVNFDFKEAAPYTMEFTAGFLRFFSGPLFLPSSQLVWNNDGKTVISITLANPANIKTATAHGWVTGQQVQFVFLGANNPLLQNRTFLIQVLSVDEFAIFDAITGDSINGADLGPLVSATVVRVLEIATPYTGELWRTVRSIPADIPTTNNTTPGAVLLQATIKPYVLKVETAPTSSTFATFSFEAANFKDGPYFDPVPGGTLATPSALIGNITLTLSFNAYDAAKSYSIGDYVVSSSVNYRSLTDANLGNTPAGSPANWLAVTAADAVGPNGFQGSDVGRMVRLFSEPQLWAIGVNYTAGTSIVAFGGTYYKALTTHTSAATSTPGTAPTVWALFPSGAIWTWGKILSLSNIIDRALAGSASIGDMTSGGGLAAAFDGVISQVASASAEKATSGSASLSSYVGKNYAAASDQAISQATLYPSSDMGLVFGTGEGWTLASLVVNLRGKASLPANAADGTLIGSTGAIGDTTAPINITSVDPTTAWKYVWVEILSTITANEIAETTLTHAVGELSLFNPAGTGVSQGVVVQLIGDALLYTTAIRVWRLGLYSTTTGWPSCGTYHEGRLWLSGAVANRIDSSKSNDIFNFAPTNPDGSVAGNNGISYTFNAPDVNPIFWMVPDHQGIVCGTQAGEWLVQATSNNVPLTPTTIQAHRYTTYKCANIEPKRTANTLAVVQSFKRALLEYFSEVFSGKFTAHDLASDAKHLVASGIEEIAYQDELVPTIWARCGDGSLVGFTYQRTSLVSSEKPVTGWHRTTLGSGRTVESICVASNTDGTLDALCAVTNDASGVRHVELMTNIFTETDDIANAWFLDDAVRPPSTSTTSVASVDAPYGGLTINGLWHLNGKTVQVSVAGLDCGQTEFGNPIADFVVSNGSITVPYGDGISAGSGEGLFTAAFAAAAVATGQIVVGFTYNSDGQLLRPAMPADSGARNGPAFCKTRRQHRYAVQVVNTAALSIGTTFTSLDPIPFKSENQSGERMPPLQTFTGVYADTIEDDYSLDSMLAWRISRPLPAMLAAIGGFIQTQDQ